MIFLIFLSRNLYAFETHQLAQSTTLSFGVHDDRIIFDISSKNSGYVAFGLAPDTSMNNSEIVTITRSNGETLLFEYEGIVGYLKAKTENGIWQIDSQSQSGSEYSVRVSRAASAAGCTICKDIARDIPWDSRRFYIYFFRTESKQMLKGYFFLIFQKYEPALYRKVFFCS